MSTLSAFLAENALPVEHVKVVVSKRFLDENKNPIEWEIKAIDTMKDDALRKSCLRRVPIPGKKNQYQQDLDTTTYLGKLATSCVVFPDLNSSELQDSYRVLGAETLLKTMLTPGEFNNLLQEIQEICGFDVPLSDMVEEAKN